jgi:hypothetical protein
VRCWNEANRPAPNEANRAAPNEANRAAPNEANRPAPNEANRAAPNEANRAAPNEANRAAARQGAARWQERSQFWDRSKRSTAGKDRRRYGICGTKASVWTEFD